MNKKLAVISAGATIVIVSLSFMRASLHHDLYERFPEIDRKVIRKAFTKMMFKALTNKAYDLNGMSDADIDLVFLREVRLITE